MEQAIASEVDESVVAPLRFTVNDGNPVIAKVFVPGGEHDRRAGTFEWHEVEIHDARPDAANLRT